MCLLYAVSLRVGCVGCYTVCEGCVCVFYWKTEDLVCLNRFNAALDEWHSETWIRGRLNFVQLYFYAAWVSVVFNGVSRLSNDK